jgi:hypothetical protein
MVERNFRRRGIRISEEGLQILRVAQRRKGWTSNHLWADEAKVSLSTVRRFLRGGAVDRQAFAALCQALGIDDWQLISADIENKSAFDSDNNDVIATKILILAANPKSTTRLRLDEEARDIDEGLRRAKHREQFNLEQRWAVRPRDIQRAMLDINPQIVHFSGHGVYNEGLVLEDETGQAKTVSESALAGLFQLFSDRVECVVLNACYSEIQAKAIAQHIPYVIGINQSISDRAAIEFTVGFYDALAAGRSVEFAYELGCSAIQLAGVSERFIPILQKHSALLSDTVTVSGQISTSKTQQIDEQSSGNKWVLILNANLDESFSRADLESTIERLRYLSGDESLRIDSIEYGSIILKLDGSEEGFKVIQALYKEGKLTELLGLSVKYVGYEVLQPTSTDRKNLLDVFFSYSHKDEDLRNELAIHLSILERDGVISGWCDRQISAGKEWANEIDARMNIASIILLLVSSDFIASDYCWNIEMKRAMERHKAGEACVIPVILRPVNWERAPFGRLQALPKNAKPVTSWGNRDEAFLDISQGIEAVVDRFCYKGVGSRQPHNKPVGSD